MDVSCGEPEEKGIVSPEDRPITVHEEAEQHQTESDINIVEEPEFCSELTETAQESTETDDPLGVIRCRYYVEFVSPFKMDCVDEWTLYHNGSTDDEIGGFYLEFTEFKLNLQIIDSDHRLLEFHAPESQYFQNLEAVDNGDRGEHDDASPDANIQLYPIVIEFPSDRPIRPGDYRTIRLSYSREVPFYSSKRVGGKITIPLDNSLRTYITIKQTESYFFRNILLVQPDHGEAFEIQYLTEKDQIQILDNYQKGGSTILIKTPISECSLDISFAYEVYYGQKRWFDLGVALGISTIILYPCLLIHDVFFPPIGSISIPLAIITYLTVTKGWLFMKDIDKVLAIRFPKLGFSLNYNNSYIFLISILFIEVLLSLVLIMGAHIYGPANVIYQAIVILIGLFLKAVMSIY